MAIFVNMSITAVEAVCYGWLAGIGAILLFLLYGVDTLVKLTAFVYHLRRVSTRWGHLDKVDADRYRSEASHYRSSAMQEMGYEGVEGSPTRVSPLRHSAECVLSWYEDDVIGSPMDCRLALSEYTVTVYQRFPLQSSDTTCTAAEHIRGRFDIRRARARERKGPFGRDKKSSPNPFAGRVLLVYSDEGATPLMTMMPHEAETSAAAMNTTNTNARCGACGGGAHMCEKDCVAAAAAAVCEVSTMGEPAAMNSAIDLDRALQAKDRDTASWKAMIIKFANPREMERWRCMLLDLDEVNEWRAFVRNMPNQESANLILSRFCFQSMRSRGMTGALRSAIRKKLEKTSAQTLPRMLEGQILLDNFVIGKRIPWISSVSEPTVSSSGEFGFDFNLHYQGDDEGFAFYFRLALSFYGLRIPHLFFALKLVELEATLHVNVAPPPSNKVWIGGHRPPTLRVKTVQGTATGQGILHRILIALPDLSEIVTNLLKLYLFHNMILPNLDDFPLPSVNKSPPNSPVTKLRTFDWRRAAMLSRAPVRVRDGAHGTVNDASRSERMPATSAVSTTTRKRHSLHAHKRASVSSNLSSHNVCATSVTEGTDSAAAEVVSGDNRNRPAVMAPFTLFSCSSAASLQPPPPPPPYSQDQQQHACVSSAPLIDTQDGAGPLPMRSVVLHSSLPSERSETHPSARARGQTGRCSETAPWVKSADLSPYTSLSPAGTNKLNSNPDTTIIMGSDPNTSNSHFSKQGSAASALVHTSPLVKLSSSQPASMVHSDDPHATHVPHTYTSSHRCSVAIPRPTPAARPSSSLSSFLSVSSSQPSRITSSCVRPEAAVNSVSGGGGSSQRTPSTGASARVTEEMKKQQEKKDRAKPSKVSIRQLRRVLKQKGENMMAWGALNAASATKHGRTRL